MNPNISDAQQSKKTFAPNAGAANRMQEQDDSREQSAPANRQSRSEQSAQPENRQTRSEQSSQSENRGEQGAKVTAIREGGAQKTDAQSQETKSTKSKEVAKEQPAKEPTLVDNLDLALMNASITIGDWVKKIEALSPKEGGIARASKFTVTNLQSLQNYIGDNGTKEIAEGAWRFVRRAPLPVGLAIVGAGVGLYISRNNLKAPATETSEQK
jgi:hypothetical protein